MNRNWTPELRPFSSTKNSLSLGFLLLLALHFFFLAEKRFPADPAGEFSPPPPLDPARMRCPRAPLHAQHFPWVPLRTQPCASRVSPRIRSRERIATEAPKGGYREDTYIQCVAH